MQVHKRVFLFLYKFFLYFLGQPKIITYFIYQEGKWYFRYTKAGKNKWSSSLIKNLRREYGEKINHIGVWAKELNSDEKATLILNPNYCFSVYFFNNFYKETIMYYEKK